MTLSEARRLLKVDAGADPAALRRAFLEAAKLAHPDRAGGDEARFRQVVMAYERVSRPQIATAPVAPAADELPIDPAFAFHGGKLEHVMEDGRNLRIRLPAGLRAGDRVRVGETILRIAIRGDGGLRVRGDDLWLDARVAPHILSEGGRIALETPLGRRIVWINRKAAEAGLVRLPGLGLPARGSRRQGHMFVQLTAAETADAGARGLLRRFAAAWAA